MSENGKTIAFLGVGLLVAVGAWATGPRTARDESTSIVGKELVASFDPTSIARLEIMKFNEDSATVEKFVVQKSERDGKKAWSIPSHDDYPTDAENQFAAVATTFLEKPVLEMVTDNPGEHAKYGVLDPDPSKRRVGDTGVGTRVTLTDAGGKPLADVIVGEEPTEQNDLRYVRLTGDDNVYVVALQTDKITTKFENWIERNLLKISSWDIDRVWIQDYTVDPLQGALIQRSQMKLDYNDTGDPKWKLLENLVFQNRAWKEVPLGEDQELNTQKLDDMRFALDDLKIVDVRRKPEGLSADLKAAESFGNDIEAVESLAERGFYMAQLGNRRELFSNQGEVRVSMKDGVEYVLRFGGIAAGGETGGAEGEEKSGENRYLFVMAEFNADAIEKPNLEAVPDAAPTEPAKADTEATGAANSAEGDGKTESAADEKADGEKAESGEVTGEPKSETELAAERERIEKENKRKMEEYEEKVANGQKHVKELNQRFADWYYVISNDVYEKIHLSRDDVIKLKEKKDDAATGEGEAHDHGAMPAADPLGDLDALKNQGLGAGGAGAAETAPTDTAPSQTPAEEEVAAPGDDAAMAEPAMPDVGPALNEPPAADENPDVMEEPLNDVKEDAANDQSSKDG
ncbi:MAG: DUF4340 domain-containing protein [Planctomycetota bacterium]